ncbi:hypothetical protein DL762_001804 [Monosporascus cannonballus]|uniref:Uncharacterized protein n=1 Tax=Monosporascus cannonballus TaxID=155416 RepID=A0ABY0HFU8_9PEZI|nr:hypothetical protein DL762_001804 [Monosporascus cannonballus]
MSKQLYETFDGDEVTDEMLAEAAVLFNENYGIWNKDSHKPGTIEKISMDFIRQNADAIMKASPIPYIKEAQLRGILFEPQNAAGIISGVNTKFFVDHEDPLKALSLIRQEWDWPLGDLPDGHEYLLILPGKQHRSRSQSSTGSASKAKSLG